jgi:hypothetical protein
MYVAIRRYDGIEPGAVAEFVRRVTAEAGPSATAVDQEFDRWAAEGGFVPLPRETPGFEATTSWTLGMGWSCPSVSSEIVPRQRSPRAGRRSGPAGNLADLIRRPPEVLMGEVVAQRTTEHTSLA